MLVCLNKSSKEASDLASLPGLLLCRPLELPPILIPVSDPLKTSHCSLEEPKCFIEPAKPVTVSPQPTLPAFLPLTLSSVPLQHLTFPHINQCRFLPAGNAILPSLRPSPLHLTFQDPGRSLLRESSPYAQILLVYHYHTQIIIVWLWVSSCLNRAARDQPVFIFLPSVHLLPLHPTPCLVSNSCLRQAMLPQFCPTHYVTLARLS